jgi:ribonucleoside-triphosphate reductase
MRHKYSKGTSCGLLKKKIVLASLKRQRVGGTDFSCRRSGRRVCADCGAALSHGTALSKGYRHVEKGIIESGHAKSAKEYILYREKRRAAREQNALIGVP